MEIVWSNFVTAFGFWLSWSDEFPRTHWIFKIIQEFLVFFCRDEFPRTYIQNCIFMPSLRTRSCVLIECFCVKFPCFWLICLTKCFEYPRTFRRNRILHSRRTCRDSEDHVHRRWLWLCHDPVLSFQFLHPSRRRFSAAGQAEILRAPQQAEMADVKQMKKIVPLITCEISFRQYVCTLVFCVDILDLNLGVEQLCGFWMHVWLLNSNLWWSFQSRLRYPQSVYSIAPNRENFAFDGT